MCQKTDSLSKVQLLLLCVCSLQCLWNLASPWSVRSPEIGPKRCSQDTFFTSYLHLKFTSLPFQRFHLDELSKCACSTFRLFREKGMIILKINILLIFHSKFMVYFYFFTLLMLALFVFCFLFFFVTPQNMPVRRSVE